MPFTNIIPPAGIVMINNDQTAQVQEVIIKQLFIDRIMTGDEWDTIIAQNSGFPDDFRRSGKRLLILRSFIELQNREYIDIVLFLKNGLASLEKNKFGPIGITFPIVNMSWGNFEIYSLK